MSSTIVARCKQACFQVFVVLPEKEQMGWVGSAVAVFRDSPNRETMYLATAAHVVPSPAELASGAKVVLIDSTGRRHTEGVHTVVRDVSHDYAIIAFTNAPRAIPIASIAQKVADGDDVIAIGWPLGMDALSVSRGCVRSATWSGTSSIVADAVPQIAVDCPLMPGNSGGGVFVRATGALAGVVSWGYSDTFAFIVPGALIYGSIIAVQYEARPRPWPVARNQYFLGADLMMLGVDTTAALSPRHPALVDRGAAGAFVYPLQGTPVAAAGIRTPSVTTDEEGRVLSIDTLDILWALAPPPANPASEPAWVVLGEDAPLTSIIDNIDAKRAGIRRTPTPWRSSASPFALSSAQPPTPTMRVLMLVSGITDGQVDDGYRTLQVDLVPRSDWIAQQRPEDRDAYLNGDVGHGVALSIHSRRRKVHADIASRLASAGFFDRCGGCKKPPIELDGTASKEQEVAPVCEHTARS